MRASRPAVRPHVLTSGRGPASAAETTQPPTSVTGDYRRSGGDRPHSYGLLLLSWVPTAGGQSTRQRPRQLGPLGKKLLLRGVIQGPDSPLQTPPRVREREALHHHVGGRLRRQFEYACRLPQAWPGTRPSNTAHILLSSNGTNRRTACLGHSGARRPRCACSNTILPALLTDGSAGETASKEGHGLVPVPGTAIDLGNKAFAIFYTQFLWFQVGRPLVPIRYPGGKPASGDRTVKTGGTLANTNGGLHTSVPAPSGRRASPIDGPVPFAHTNSVLLAAVGALPPRSAPIGDCPALASLLPLLLAARLPSLHPKSGKCVARSAAARARASSVPTATHGK